MATRKQLGNHLLILKAQTKPLILVRCMNI